MKNFLPAGFKENIHFAKVPIATIAFLFCALIAAAQPSTAHRKSSNAYKNNYQRTFSGAQSNSSFEIRANGTLWAWGSNTNGELGDGTTVRRSLPVPIGTDSWTIIASGNHTLGIKVDGTLWAWGSNSNGQMGDGTIVNKLIPTQIGADNKWVSVSAGFLHSVAIKADGTLWAWGDNAVGELGDGTLTQRNSPVQIGTDNKWIAVETGYTHTLAIKSDGTLWAWGQNNNGQIGDGTTTTRTSPVQIGTDNKWVSITGGTYHSLAIKSDGTLWSWGYNAVGVLGDGTIINKLVPTQVAVSSKWLSVSTGDQNSFAIKNDGTLWGWGGNVGGYLGNGNSTQQNLPVQIGTEDKWTSVMAGKFHTLATKSDGTLWAWGRNLESQLGIGNTTDKTTPTITSISQVGVLHLSLGYTHSAALNLNGTLWTWGSNASGQLGDGTIVAKTSPVQIGTDDNWVSIASGFEFNVGIKNDGTIWAWGNNANGQLGDGTIINRSTPIQIGTDNKWIAVAAGLTHTLALKADGTLWTWGDNGNGQLGDGTTVQRTSPVQIGTDTRWVSITAGSSHSLALKSNGTLWAWGLNANGRLGDATTVQRTSPVQIGTDTKWTSLSAGASHSLGTKSDGTLWAWGLNSSAQLGDGTVTQRTSPVQIGTDTKWLSIAGSNVTSSGIKADGTLWGWGINSSGEFGNGTTTVSGSPVQITQQTAVVALYSGGGALSTHTGIVKVDRTTVCLTGYNAFGQLGNGTTTNATLHTCTNALSCTPVSVTTQPIATATCLGNNASFTVVAAGTAPLTYQWQVNDGSGFVNITNTGVYSNATTATLNITGATAILNTYSYRCQLTNSCGSATSNAAVLTVNVTNTWTGSVSSVWFNPANWSCGTVPTATTDVIITGSPINNPVFGPTQTGLCHDLVKGGGGLTINLLDATLKISGNLIYNGGAFITNNNSSFEFVGAGGLQTLGGTTALNVNNITINNPNGLLMSQSIVLAGALNFQSGKIFTNGFPLQAGSVTGANSNNYVVTGDNLGNPSTIEGLNITVNPGVSQVFPIGPTAASYNPITIKNTSGPAEKFNVFVNLTPLPGATNNKTIQRTWQIDERTLAGGNTGEITLQWDAAHEGALFNRAACGLVKSNGSNIVYTGYTMQNGAATNVTGNTWNKTLTGVTSFSPWGVTSDVLVLPIHLLSFNAVRSGNNQANTSWQMADATNLAYFELQKSRDGINFNVIKNIAANASPNYSYNDYSLQDGLTYYRLKLVEVNGEISYSNTVAVHSRNESDIINLYPNPVKEKLGIDLTAAVNGNAIINITDISGRQMMTLQHAVKKGYNSIAIVTEKFPAGMYLLKMKLPAKDNVVISKFLKE